MFGPSGFWTMAPLRYAAKFDPILSLDCAPTPSTLALSKERRGSNFAIWQPCRCGKLELAAMECMEYYGFKNGKVICKDHYEDFMECRWKKLEVSQSARA